ncbi:MAG: hypothetical protein ACE5KM_17640 [Planctomycetaceae bacterium]
MRFYKTPHEFYCGIDLHTKKMYCCLVDAAGDKRVHRNIDTRGDRFLNLIAPYRNGLAGRFVWDSPRRRSRIL